MGLKQNWFKFGVLVILSIQAAFISYYLLERNQIIKGVSLAELNVKEEQQKIPECFLGRCPVYSSMDVDEDNLPESAVIVPTAMTKGAGKVEIIKNGKIVFESEELAEVGIKEVGDGDGFILQFAHGSDWNKILEVRYFYRDNKFVN